MARAMMILAWAAASAIQLQDVHTLPEIMSFEDWEAVFRAPGSLNAYATADLR